jgi:hypothetical protein
VYSAVLGILLVLSGTAGAEERFGVAVYPGARYDEATSKYMTESMQLTMACYRTKDGLDTVAAFYKKQKGLALRGDVLKENALFHSDKAEVTLQNPWLNVLTGRMMNETLISIVRK